MITSVSLYGKNESPYKRLMFAPLKASIFEQKVGSQYDYNNESLRLDIGASADLFDVYKSQNSTIAFGADFFTYTRLRSQGRMKFPVETSDYFFGVNFSGKYTSVPIEWRFRAAHISSHLVDGYSSNSEFWKEPFVYSREFFDLITAYNFSFPLRAYLGATYVFSTQPKNIGRLIPQLGLEYVVPIYEFSGNRINLSASFDMKYAEIDDNYKANLSEKVGIELLNNAKGAGLGIYLYQYDGWNYHGMFYDEELSSTSLGFEILF